MFEKDKVTKYINIIEDTTNNKSIESEEKIVFSYDPSSNYDNSIEYITLDGRIIYIPLNEIKDAEGAVVKDNKIILSVKAYNNIINKYLESVEYNTLKDKKYFYIIVNNPDDIFEEKIKFKINIDDINMLALLATTLKPRDDIKEEYGYAKALYYYIKDSNHNLKESYFKLMSNSLGNEFLCNTILLCLLEKEMREKGINEQTLNSYNKALISYNQNLEYNKLSYKNINVVKKR